MIAVESSPATPAQVGPREGYARDSVMPVVSDPTALGALMERMRGDTSLLEVGRRMGVTLQTVNQYRSYRRGKGMQVKTFLRYAAACGYRVVVER